MVQKLHPPDYLQIIQFCNWYKNNLFDNVDKQDITFFSAEAWFHLSGFINSQSHRTWSAHNPHNAIQVPLHPFKAMSRRRIIGPIIYQTKFNVAYSKEVNTLNIFFSCICNIQGLSELADQNNTVNSSSSGNNKKNVQKNLS
jgi:hypothetical protein